MSVTEATAAARQIPSTDDLTFTRKLAEQCVALNRSDINEQAWQVARHCLLDWFALTLAGANEDCTKMLTAEALEQSGRPQSTLVPAAPSRVPAAMAALVNGTASHALDFDDVNYALHGHATVAIAPALIALAEARGKSLEDVLVALVAGTEFACKTASFVGGTHYTAGWHSTTTIGSLGAAAGCARLLNLDATRCAHAVGMAATQASGLKSMFGTMAKPFHAGRAARTGVEAATLVERGFTTRDDSIECQQGLADVMHGDQSKPGTWSETPGASNDGRRFHIQNTLFKYHASCFETHASIEACRTLAEKLAFEPNEVRDSIKSIEIRTRPDNFKICNLLTPTNGLEAKFSLVHTAAMALCGIDTGDFRNFSDSICDDSTLTFLRDRSRVIADTSLRHAQARVSLTLQQRDKHTTTHEQFHDSGIPRTDLDEQQQRIIRKFDGICAVLATSISVIAKNKTDELKHCIVIAEPAAIDIAKLTAHLN